MSDTASTIALKARQQFLKNNADLFSCLKSSKDEIFQTIMAEASLHRPTRETIADFAQEELLEQPNYHAREEARKYFQKVVYDEIASAFVRCFIRGVLKEAMRFTAEAAAEYEELRYIAGELERPYVAPAVPALSPAEALEAEVIADYNGAISTDKMKVKMNNRAYKDMYVRLSETNKLESRITSLHDAGQEVR